MIIEGWPGFDVRRISGEHLSAEQYQSCCNQIWSVDRRSSRATTRKQPIHGSSVYAKRDHVNGLFPMLEKRRSRILLITAEADESVGGGENVPPQVSSWFSTNSCHPDVHPIPLGLGNSYCKVTLKPDLLVTHAGIPKTGLLYINFRPETNPSVRAPLWESYGSWAQGKSVTRHPGNVSQEVYVRTLASHRFVLCPRGNGIDTHRMWEALYLGTIPIVERHVAMESFGDLPILFVESLEGLEQGFLESKLTEMNSRQWNWEKLFLPWWRMRFEAEQKRISRPVSWGEHFRKRSPLGRFFIRS